MNGEKHDKAKSPAEPENAVSGAGDRNGYISPIPKRERKQKKEIKKRKEMGKLSETLKQKKTQRLVKYK